ncbi:AI-2E family transporter [Sphingomonas swuensis]|uniref:AI-2E family transporter n=1 Tax=Sphingomonas swuensis TaxID=977800 RepID=A0ABP7TD53_9SPHN
MAAAGENEVHVEQPGPAEFHDPLIRRELQRAWVWIGSLLFVAALVVLAQPLLLIVGGLVFAVLLDGGTRLLGRVLPIGRGKRLLIVTLAAFGFLYWVLTFAGAEFAAQFGQLQSTIEQQIVRLFAWASSLGLVPPTDATTISELVKAYGLSVADGVTGGSGIATVLGSIGRITGVVGALLGIVTSAFLIIVIGIFFAVEPKVYDRGFAWMLPMRHRADYYEVASAVGFTLRRLLFGRLVGMVVEGLFTFAMLAAGGVPMAALLGLLTGLLAFIPNIGAIVSGLLMVAVGFSASSDAGIWAIVTYFAVQNIDGYLILPYIARKTVDLAPAMVLAAQLIFGALFGFLGLLLADPIMATIKVTLEKLAERRAAARITDPAVARPDRRPAAAAAASAAVASAAAAPPSAPRSAPPS